MKIFELKILISVSIPSDQNDYLNNGLHVNFVLDLVPGP